jgi:hypothetical protein
VNREPRVRYNMYSLDRNKDYVRILTYVYFIKNSTLKANRPMGISTHIVGYTLHLLISLKYRVETL